MYDYRMSHASPVPGLQLVKPSEITNGAIVARGAWVGSGHYALDPKTPSVCERCVAVLQCVGNGTETARACFAECPG